VATDDEADEEISLEEILVEILDAQIALIDAVSGGTPLEDADGLKVRLHDLRDLLDEAGLQANNED
jgi:hypothetical protein